MSSEPYDQALVKLTQIVASFTSPISSIQKPLLSLIGKKEYQKLHIHQLLHLCKEFQKAHFSKDSLEHFTDLASKTRAELQKYKYFLGFDKAGNQSELLKNFFHQYDSLGKLITVYLQQVLMLMNQRRSFLKTAGKLVAGASLLALTKSSHIFSSPKPLKIKGINYDTGVGEPHPTQSRDFFDKQIVQQEVNAHIISNLRCNAIRAHGSSLERLDILMAHANPACELWLNPRIKGIAKEYFRSFLLTCAKRAEQYRTVKNQKIVLIVGNELSLDLEGFIQGKTYSQRVANISTSFSYRKSLNDYLQDLVNEVRKVFHGPITYSSGGWEFDFVHWDLFDIVSANKYYNKWNRRKYASQIKAMKQKADQLKKPFVVTEFGCTCAEDGDDLGEAGWQIGVDWSRRRLKNKKKRDEMVQARYILDRLNTFSRIGVDGAFVYTFIEPKYVDYNTAESYDWSKDLDLASFGLVRVTPNGELKPKKAYFALAHYNQ